MASRSLIAVSLCTSARRPAGCAVLVVVAPLGGVEVVPRGFALSCNAAVGLLDTHVHTRASVIVYSTYVSCVCSREGAVLGSGDTE